jgi:hypothetical protein
VGVVHTGMGHANEWLDAVSLENIMDEIEMLSLCYNVTVELTTKRADN